MKGIVMRVIAINIARILATLCVIVGFSAATPPGFSAPKKKQVRLKRKTIAEVCHNSVIIQ